MLKRILGLLKRIIGLGLTEAESVVDSCESTEALTKKGLIRLEEEQEERYQSSVRLKVSLSKQTSLLKKNKVNSKLLEAKAREAIENGEEAEAHSYLDRKDIVDNNIKNLEEAIRIINGQITELREDYKRANFEKEEYKVLTESILVEKEINKINKSKIDSKRGVGETATAIFNKAQERNEENRAKNRAEESTIEEFGINKKEKKVVTRTLSALDRLKGFKEEDVVKEVKPEKK